MAKRNEVAAYFHGRMARDDRFGYTQGSGRWGSGPLEDWECQGVVGHFLVGDRDCSSSVIDCWNEALNGSVFEGALSGATYTGNMRWVFVNSGLFEWHPMGDGYIAQTGDVYLNETQHTAMCQSAVPDILSEALINEWGGITGGQVGDQTGREFVVRGYWDFPWDGILAYNHRADDADKPPKEWGLCMWRSHGGDNQRFRVEETEGGSMLVCKADGRAVDVSGGAPEMGAQVILYEPNGNPNQLWKFREKDNSNVVEIVSAMDSSMCLDVAGGSREEGAGLILWERNDGANQEWFLLDNKDGTVTVVNNGLGPKMVLDCPGGGR